MPRCCFMLTFYIGHNCSMPVARVFARGVTWVSDVYVCMQDWGGGSLGASPRKFLEVDALRLLLRPFWDCSNNIRYMAHGVVYPILGLLTSNLCQKSIKLYTTAKCL